MKNILICVTGLTPQIVTEALYCLSVQQNIKIDELYILTTHKGKEVLLGKDDSENTPNASLYDEIDEMCKKHDIAHPTFEKNNKHVIVAEEESIELYDIRTDKDNILFPNRAAEFIKEKTAEPENVLYCVISGGRKTMSVHLANALSMFGRQKDKLLHVLTSKEHEFKGFYPKTIKEDKALNFAEIPYVRLRSLLTKTLSKKDYFEKSYSDFVKYTQFQLSLYENKRKLVINTQTREVSYLNKFIKMEPLQFILYAVIVQRKINNLTPYSILDITQKDFADVVKDFIEEYSIATNHFEKNSWKQEGFNPDRFHSIRSKINKKISTLFEDQNYYELYQIRSLRKYSETSYTIDAEKEILEIK